MLRRLIEKSPGGRDNAEAVIESLRNGQNEDGHTTKIPKMYHCPDIVHPSSRTIITWLPSALKVIHFPLELAVDGPCCGV